MSTADLKSKPIAAIVKDDQGENDKKPREEDDSDSKSSTIDLTDENKKGSGDFEKKVEKFEKEAHFLNSLNNQLAFKDKDVKITGSQGFRDTCNTCRIKKPINQSWEIPNRTEDHIKALLAQKGHSQGISLLFRNNSKFFKLNCELCDTWYDNALSYQAHKLDSEHKTRVSDVLQWRKAALINHYASSKGDRISKPHKPSARELSKALLFSTRKNKK